MKVDQAEFVTSAVGPDQYPADFLPEIALSGRSNVGKSSLINRMINRKNLARTSSKPGKTQTLNFYRINRSFYFVDVPGYGYAQVPKTERAKWGRFVEQYLLEREPLKLVLLIVDLRHPPSNDDVAMYDWLTHYDLPVCVVATKADKVAKGKWAKHVKIVKDTLLMRDSHPFVLFSAETGLGKEQLWEIIRSATGEKKDEASASE